MAKLLSLDLMEKIKGQNQGNIYKCVKHLNYPCKEMLLIIVLWEKHDKVKAGRREGRKEGGREGKKDAKDEKQE